jgi:hypothetical protein
MEIPRHKARPLQKAPFCPISASDSNFNPQNIQYIQTVKIITFLDLDQNWTFFKGLKASKFSRSSGRQKRPAWSAELEDMSELFEKLPMELIW